MEGICLKIKGNGFPERDSELEEKIQKDYDSLPELVHTGHEGQIDDVLSAIGKDEEPLIRVIDGRNTLEIITAIYKSGSTEQTVKLPISKDDPFYTAKGIIKNVKHFYEKTTSAINLSDEAITVGSDYKNK